MRQYITSDTLASQIRLLRSTFSGSFLLVEGETDLRLFGRFIDRTNCRMIFCHGREKLLGTVEILDRAGFRGHLGIVDKDFSEVLEEDILSDNVVFTDENDIELTIFHSDTFERFIAEYCNRDRLAAFEEAKREPIRRTLVRIVSTIGALRCLSKLKGWHLDFDDMTFRFSTRRDLEIDMDSQIEHLRGRSQPTSMPIGSIVREELKSFQTKFSDARKYICGHDLCEVICKGIHDVFGRAQVTLARHVHAVEEVFRAAFSAENFRATRLYADIKSWEIRNRPYIILIA